MNQITTMKSSHRVRSCPLAPLRLQVEPQFLPNRSAQKPSYGMGLPARGFHHFFECRAARLFEQPQNLRRAKSCGVALRRPLLSGRRFFFPGCPIRSCTFLAFRCGLPVGYGDHVRPFPFSLYRSDPCRPLFDRWFKRNFHVLAVVFLKSLFVDHRTPLITQPRRKCKLISE
jgi:hypothetical protein